jgi:hypothetical protein
MATCRIVVDPAGLIDVIGPVASRRVSVSEVVAMKHDGGLRLVSGHRIGRVAYGSSLVGQALRQARSAKAVRRIEAAIGGVLSHAELPDRRQDTVVWKLRARALVAMFGINCGLVLGTGMLHLIETATQH